MKPLKSIWKRRGRYGWIVLEIIVASAIAFFVLDPSVGNISDSTRNYIYDIYRLVLLQVSLLEPHYPHYDP